MLLMTLLMVLQVPAPAGCASEPKYTTLTPWIGEWDVKNPAGQHAGASRVERSPDGCGLIEHWVGRAGVIGTGLHAFDRNTQAWTHLWVDATGFSATLTATVENGQVVYARSSLQPGGAERKHRMILAPADGRVTQTGDHSDDGGKTWQRDFQLTYNKKPAAV